MAGSDPSTFSGAVNVDDMDIDWGSPDSTLGTVLIETASRPDRFAGGDAVAQPSGAPGAHAVMGDGGSMPVQHYPGGAYAMQTPRDI